MSKKFLTVSTTLSADVAASGTFTVGYPTGTDEDSFAGYGHKAVAIGNVMSSPGDFTLSFGSASITFTYAASKTTMPAGTKVSIDLNLPANLGREMTKLVVDNPGVSILTLVRVDLGSPLITDPNRIAESQDVSSAGAITLVSTAAQLLLSSGAGAAPFGRALICTGGASTTAVITVTGTDYLGNVLVEAFTLANTTPQIGKKAFATVTAAATDGDTDSGFIIGDSDLLGLPFYLPGIDNCPTVFEFEDNILKANAGTFVAGVDTAVTATTGDVRGTYTPVTSLPDGAQNFVLFIPSTDPEYQGQVNFAG